jgi:hypothetical protein
MVLTVENESMQNAGRNEEFTAGSVKRRVPDQNRDT